MACAVVKIYGDLYFMWTMTRSGRDPLSAHMEEEEETSVFGIYAQPILDDGLSNLDIIYWSVSTKVLWHRIPPHRFEISHSHSAHRGCQRLQRTERRSAGWIAGCLTGSTFKGKLSSPHPITTRHVCPPLSPLNIWKKNESERSISILTKIYTHTQALRWQCCTAEQNMVLWQHAHFCC